MDDEVCKLQRECPDFKHMFAYKEKRLSTEDEDLYKRIGLDSGQYELDDGGKLMHSFQHRAKNKVKMIPHAH